MFKCHTLLAPLVAVLAGVARSEETARPTFQFADEALKEAPARDVAPDTAVPEEFQEALKGYRRRRALPDLPAGADFRTTHMEFTESGIRIHEQILGTCTVTCSGCDSRRKAEEARKSRESSPAVNFPVSRGKVALPPWLVVAVIALGLVVGACRACSGRS